MTIEFRNCKAAFLWGFAALFLGFVVAMSWVLLRDGPPAGYSLTFMLAVYALFWASGLGLAVYAAGHPCIHVTARSHGDVQIRWRYPHRSMERRLSPRDRTPAQCVEGRDSDGDPYFRVRISLPDGMVVDLWEGHDHAQALAECQRYNAAIGVVAPPR